MRKMPMCPPEPANGSVDQPVDGQRSKVSRGRGWSGRSVKLWNVRFHLSDWSDGWITVGVAAATGKPFTLPKPVAGGRR